jgi:hypothetical protein
MTQRQRLDNRRLCETFSFVCNDLDYTATISRFPDKRLAEIFLSNRRSGSHSDAAAKDSAVVASIALQYGVPVETPQSAAAGFSWRRFIATRHSARPHSKHGDGGALENLRPTEVWRNTVGLEGNAQHSQC